MIKIYYNPKNNKIALGIFCLYSDGSFHLLTRELDDNTFIIMKLNKNWLKNWEYIGDYGNQL